MYKHCIILVNNGINYTYQPVQGFQPSTVPGSFTRVATRWFLGIEKNPSASRVTPPPVIAHAFQQKHPASDSPGWWVDWPCFRGVNPPRHHPWDWLTGIFTQHDSCWFLKVNVGKYHHTWMVWQWDVMSDTEVVVEPTQFEKDAPVKIGSFL